MLLICNWDYAWPHDSYFTLLWQAIEANVVYCTPCLKKGPTFLLLCVCQIWTDFNKIGNAHLNHFAFNDSFKCTCNFCVDGSICHFKFPEVVSARISSEVSILCKVLLCVASRIRLPVFIKIGTYVTDTEQKRYHVFDTVNNIHLILMNASPRPIRPIGLKRCNWVYATIIAIFWSYYNS